MSLDVSPNKSLPCPGCGKAVDPLRAGHVTIHDGAFSYYCSRDCKDLPLTEVRFGYEEETAAPPVVAPPVAPRVATTPPESAPLAIPEHALDEPDVPDPPARPRATLNADVAGIALPLVGLCFLGLGVRSLAFVFALLGLTALLFRQSLAAEPKTPSKWIPAWGLLLLGTSLGWVTLETGSAETGLFPLVLLLLSGTALSEALVGRDHARIQALVSEHKDALDIPVPVLREYEAPSENPHRVKPGERFRAASGDRVGADALVIAGTAEVTPYLDGSSAHTRREGDTIFAGARVEQGALDLVVTHTGSERAFGKLLFDPSARIDVAAPTLKTVSRTMTVGAPLLGGLAFVATWANLGNLALSLAAAGTALTLFGNRMLPSLLRTRAVRAILRAQRVGIVFRNAQVFENAMHVDTVVFADALLAKDPEVIDTVCTEGKRAEDVLGLACAALEEASHPLAPALVRGARNIKAPKRIVRSATYRPGLGVSGLVEDGSPIHVGYHSLLVEERVSISELSQRAQTFEAEGRVVLHVADARELIGLVVLADRFVPYAERAVQKALLRNMEPILLCEEARLTGERWGKDLGIEHVKAEVAPKECEHVVRELASAGRTVAAVAHRADHGALLRADLAIAKDALSQECVELSITLADARIDHAMDALAIPQDTAKELRRAVLTAGVPSGLCLLLVAFGAVPPFVCALGLFVSVVGLSALDRHLRKGENTAE